MRGRQMRIEKRPNRRRDGSEGALSIALPMFVKPRGPRADLQILSRWASLRRCRARRGY